MKIQIKKDHNIDGSELLGRRRGSEVNFVDSTCARPTAGPPAQVAAVCFAAARTPIAGADSVAALRLNAEHLELRALARWEDDGGSFQSETTKAGWGFDRRP